MEAMKHVMNDWRQHHARQHEKHSGAGLRMAFRGHEIATAAVYC
jgi:hypothetical protein